MKQCLQFWTTLGWLPLWLVAVLLVSATGCQQQPGKPAANGVQGETPDDNPPKSSAENTQGDTPGIEKQKPPAGSGHQLNINIAVIKRLMELPSQGRHTPQCILDRIEQEVEYEYYKSLAGK